MAQNTFHLPSKSLYLKRHSMVDHVYLFMLLSLLAGIVYLKINSLFSWQYTSDIFTDDQILQETLSGNFGLEYTFGNGFGDHAYIFFLFLLPLKIVFGKHMVLFLSLLSPIAYGITGITLYFFIKYIVDVKQAFILSSIFLLAFGTAFYGLYEDTYGFHPASISGFFAVTFTLFLVWYEKLRSDNLRATPQFFGFVSFFVLFMSLKEEMALLGVLYFSVILFAKRNFFYLFFLIISLVTFILDLIFISLSQTVFNRTNALLVDSLKELLKSQGLRLLFYHPEAVDYTLFLYWLSIVCLTITMLAIILLLKQVNIYAISLFAVGLAKMGSSFLVADFSLVTWHNFPGIILLTGAIILQLAQQRKTNNKYLNIMVASILMTSIIIFAWVTVPFVMTINLSNTHSARLIIDMKTDLYELKKEINPKQVVAIPPSTAIEWVDGFRYSFFPRGVTMSPAGIAEYVVLPNHHEIGLWDKQDVVLERDFLVIRQNGHFLLLKRIQPSVEYKQSRQTFIELFGKGALGL